MSSTNEWPLVKLGEVATFIRGVTFKPSDKVGPGEGVPVMRTKNVQTSLDLSDIIRIPANLVKNDRYLHSGDTLVSTANSWNLVGKCSWVPELTEPTAIGGFVSALRANSEQLLPSYLYYWFNSSRIQTTVRSFSNQTTNIANLAIKRCLDLKIPLPPLAEQQRIAEILDAVATAILSSQEQLTALSEIQANLLTDTDETEYVPLGELAQIRSGTVKPSEQPYCDLPHIAPDNIESGTGRLQNINTAAKDGVISNKYAFYAGDLLYSKIRPYLNKFAIPQFDGVCSADMYALIPKEPVTAEYLAMTLQSTKFLAYADQHSGRASIPKINRKSLAAFPVPAHSELEIQGITNIYQKAEATRHALQRKIKSLQELQESISTRAFTGELYPPQD